MSTTVRENKNMAPAAAFLRFKSCDVRENCIQVKSDGIAFINGYAMIKYISMLGVQNSSVIPCKWKAWMTKSNIKIF